MADSSVSGRVTPRSWSRGESQHAALVGPSRRSPEPPLGDRARCGSRNPAQHGVRRYVHGGLRPRNVVLSDDGQLKLLDVELCGLRDQQELTDVEGGKPPREHLAPEQIRHDPITEKSDIYAFTLLVYELLCGLPPFPAGTQEAAATRPLMTVPVPMRHRRRTIPSSVDALIMARSTRSRTSPLAK